MDLRKLGRQRCKRVAFASRTGFVTGLGEASARLSTDFLGAGMAAAEAVLHGPLRRNWAAARPGLSADLDGAGFAAVTGLSVDFVPAPENSAAGLAGTSRVSVFKLAW